LEAIAFMEGGPTGARGKMLRSKKKGEGNERRMGNVAQGDPSKAAWLQSFDCKPANVNPESKSSTEMKGAKGRRKVVMYRGGGYYTEEKSQEKKGREEKRVGEAVPRSRLRVSVKEGETTENLGTIVRTLTVSKA